jgi:hypothetical protein
MKNIFNISLLSLLLMISSCYDELDKTEAFEPFTRLSFTPQDGDFTGSTDIVVEINAPGLESATAVAVGGVDEVDLGTLSFSGGVATLTVPVTTLNGADRINFTAVDPNGKPFTSRYQITY